MAKASVASGIVGKKLREWREAAGLRQDDVARTAREFGHEWARDTVASIEGGRREVRLDELLSLPLIVDAFPSSCSREYSRVADFLGPAAPLLERPTDESREVATELAVSAVLPASESNQKYLEAQCDAEQKAARQLNISPYDIVKLAYNLWGRSLTDERDARVMKKADADASARSLQAHRGHVTRVLLTDLRAEIELVKAEWDRVALRLWDRSWDDELERRVEELGDPVDRERAAIRGELAKELKAAMDEEED